MQIIFTYDNNIQQKILTTVKTATPKEFKFFLVHEIKCIQCNSIHIGQTCRFLYTRMLERMQDRLKIIMLIVLLLYNMHINLNTVLTSKK